MCSLSPGARQAVGRALLPGPCLLSEAVVPVASCGGRGCSQLPRSQAPEQPAWQEAPELLQTARARAWADQWGGEGQVVPAPLLAPRGPAVRRHSPLPSWWTLQPAPWGCRSLLVGLLLPVPAPAGASAAIWFWWSGLGRWLLSSEPRNSLSQLLPHCAPGEPDTEQGRRASDPGLPGETLLVRAAGHGRGHVPLARAP